jgi:hypothetical protein
MENISLTEEVSHKVKDKRNRRKANWIGHILVGNYLLKHVIDRKMRKQI